MHWIFAHLIGDYILQNDWMALNKKDNNWVCFVHAIVYIIPFIFVDLQAWQAGLICSQHYLQDRTNFVVWFMKIKGSKLFATGVCSPWSIIITDNILHILWIAFVVWLPEGFKLL